MKRASSQVFRKSGLVLNWANKKLFPSSLLRCIPALSLIAVLAACATPRAEPEQGLPLHHHTATGYRNYPHTEPEPLKGIFFNIRRVSDYFARPPVPGDHSMSEEEAIVGYYRHEDEDTLTWLGHSTFLIKIGGKVILTDPFLSDIASPFFIGPRRFIPPGITHRNLPPIDVIMVSHDHADHLDAKAIEELPRKETIEVIVPLGLKPFFTERGYGRVTELDWNQAASVGDVRFEALPAVHSSGRKAAKLDWNKTLWCSWAISAGGMRIFLREILLTRRSLKI